MPRILVIQFRLPGTSPFDVEPIVRILGDSCELVFKNALAREVNWMKPEKELRGISGVILAGSSVLYFDGGEKAPHDGKVLTTVLVEEAKFFARYLIDHDIPTLGICFGHQLLGYAAGANVKHSCTEGKTGTYEVGLTDVGKADLLMQGMPANFKVHYGHKDVICELPQGATVLAHGNDLCRFSALKFGKHVYSVQFHPDFSHEDMRGLFTRSPEYVPEGKTIEELFEASVEAEQILKNFAGIAVGRV